MIATTTLIAWINTDEAIFMDKTASDADRAAADIRANKNFAEVYDRGMNGDDQVAKLWMAGIVQEEEETAIAQGLGLSVD